MVCDLISPFETNSIAFGASPCKAPTATAEILGSFNRKKTDWEKQISLRLLSLLPGGKAGRQWRERRKRKKRAGFVTPGCGIQRATRQQRRAEENWMSYKTNALGRRADEENRPQVLPVIAKHKTEDFVYCDKGTSIQQIWENTSPFSSQIYQDFTEILILIKFILN